MSASLVLNRYYSVLLVFWAPVTSLLIFPHIQGTTPGYILCFIGLPLVLLSGEKVVRDYIVLLFLCFAVWCFFCIFSQFFGLIWYYQIFEAGLVLVDDADLSKIFRVSLFTQSIYLFAVVLYFSFVYFFYESKWDSWLCVSATMMASYGIYEFIFFMFFERSGDFISNRMFGSDMSATGSAAQTMVVGGVWLTRVKSLTGEPSMYALTMMPFLFYAYAMRWRAIVKVTITASVILTASTSALLAAAVALSVALLHGRVRLRLVFLAIGVFAVFFALTYEFAVDLVDQVILAKALGENLSGSERAGTFFEMLRFWSGLHLAPQLVGVGFGYVRSTDFFSTLLVNCGLLGLTVFLVLFLYPVFRLGGDRRSVALKQCVLSTMVVMLVSVPEYAYLSPWTFLAIAYRDVVRPPTPKEVTEK
jgi:hypothetical protein